MNRYTDTGVTKPARKVVRKQNCVLHFSKIGLRYNKFEAQYCRSRNENKDLVDINNNTRGKGRRVFL